MEPLTHKIRIQIAPDLNQDCNSWISIHKEYYSYAAAKNDYDRIKLTGEVIGVSLYHYHSVIEHKDNY